jgi:hypothetical protein
MPDPDRITRVKNFTDCLEAILDGEKARRQEWPDDGTFITMRESKLVIFKPEDNMVHPLVVSEGDILGGDWVIITEKS